MGRGCGTVDPNGVAARRPHVARARSAGAHVALAPYEQGHKTPNVDTLDPILTACGFRVDVTLTARPTEVVADPVARGRELVEVLELAEMFPARHARTLTFPKFGAVA